LVGTREYSFAGAPLTTVVVVEAGALVVEVVVGAALVEVVAGTFVVEVVAGASVVDVVVGAALVEVENGAVVVTGRNVVEVGSPPGPSGEPQPTSTPHSPTMITTAKYFIVSPLDTLRTLSRRTSSRRRMGGEHPAPSNKAPRGERSPL